MALATAVVDCQKHRVKKLKKQGHLYPSASRLELEITDWAEMLPTRGQAGLRHGCLQLSVTRIELQFDAVQFVHSAPSAVEKSAHGNHILPD